MGGGAALGWVGGSRSATRFPGRSERSGGRGAPRLRRGVPSVFISDPSDGDTTFLMFDVKWSAYGDTYSVAEYEIASMAKGVAWLTRQLAGLDDRRVR